MDLGREAVDARIMAAFDAGNPSQYDSSKPRPSSTAKDDEKSLAQHFKNGTEDRRDPDNGVNPPGKIICGVHQQ
jgi:hypothetical protein